MQQDMLILSGGGINWCWYLWTTPCADGSIFVLRYDRLHRYDLERNGEEHPKINGYIEKTIESDDRTLTGVQWYTNGLSQGERKISEVANPRNIFDYK